MTQDPILNRKADDASGASIHVKNALVPSIISAQSAIPAGGLILKQENARNVMRFVILVREKATMIV